MYTIRIKLCITCIIDHDFNDDKRKEIKYIPYSEILKKENKMSAYKNSSNSE